MKYFTLKELSNSTTANARKIDNTPGLIEQANLINLVNHILDPLREVYGKPIRVNSGYRSPALNAAIGGSKTSDHMTGKAADITVGSRQENQKLFDLIQKLNLPFDQLIFEKGNIKEGPDWVHVSWNPERNRKQILYLA